MRLRVIKTCPPPHGAGGRDDQSEGLLDRARPILESGRMAIFGATFGWCRHRAMAAELARELRVPIHIDVADWRDAIHEFARKIA